MMMMMMMMMMMRIMLVMRTILVVDGKIMSFKEGVYYEIKYPA